MQIVYKSIDDLKAYQRNNKKHPEKQLLKIMDSIKEFGFKNPVLIDKDNVIIAGHGRSEAAKRLGMKEVPCISCDDLSKNQIKALRLMDNKSAELAEWDFDNIKFELDELKLDDFDIGLTGFDLSEFEEEKEVEEDDFDIEEQLKKPVMSKLGDIWLLGRHRLMCGDSTDKATVEKLMDGKKADMVFTDPPYGVRYKNNMNNKFEVIKNDDVFLDGWIKFINEVSKGFIFMWTSYQVLEKWIEITKPIGKITNMIIWSKGGGGLGDLKGSFATDYEVCLVWNRGEKLTGKRIGSVWSFNKDGGNKYLHPTQKPIALSAEAIDKTTIKNNIILDLFGGSGSTLLGAHQTGRNAYLMELDEKYVDVIVNRYKEFVGEVKDIKCIRNGEELSYAEVFKEVY